MVADHASIERAIAIQAGEDARFAKELSFPPFPRYRTIGRRRPLLGSLMAR